MIHRVDAETELLPWLFATFSEAKKTTVKQWLKNGAVRVNRRPVTQFNHLLRPGDSVLIRKPTPEDLLPKSPSWGLKILFQDDDFIVVDKPAGLLSIANDEEDERTAYRALTDFVRLGGRAMHERIWIVHRLDRETSGLMVFARTEEAKGTLQQDWDKGKKVYHAVIEGHLPHDKGTFDSYLDETNPYRVRSLRNPGPGFRRAITHYEVMRSNDKLSLVELTLETGRRHQLRVHLASVGCPIIGDEKYYAKSDPGKRLGLHACRLGFPHPSTGEWVEYSCPMPKALKRLVAITPEASE